MRGRVQWVVHKRRGTQCGFCTTGMIMAAESLLRKNATPSEAQSRAALAGNLCRCTGYQNIITAVRLAADRMQGIGVQDTGAAAARPS